MADREYYPYILLGETDIKTILSRLQEVIQPFWTGWFSDKQPLELHIKSVNQTLSVYEGSWEVYSNTASAWIAVEHADKLSEFFMVQLTGIARRKVPEASSMILSLYERFATDFRKVIFGSIGQVALGGNHALIQSKGSGAVVVKATLPNKQAFNLALGDDFIKHLLAERFTVSDVTSMGAMSFGRGLLDHLSVSVAVSAGGLTLPLQALKAFEVGQVLRLDKTTAEPFNLVLDRHGELPVHIEDVQYGRQGTRKVFQLLIK